MLLVRYEFWIHYANGDRIKNYKSWVSVAEIGAYISRHGLLFSPGAVSVEIKKVEE